ncbi:NAD(P)/FAD-dependent oxidoreductase, partial [Pantoea septica]
TLIHTQAWYQQHGVTLLAGETALKLDLATRRLETDRRELSWDRLVFATGSRPRLPAIAGVDRPQVFGFRSKADVDALLAGTGPVVVLGGGFLGIEAAAALRAQGREVTLLHHKSWLLDRQLDAQAGALLLAQLTSRGLHVVLNSGLAAVTETGVLLADGRALPAAQVVIAIGVEPEIAIAAAAGVPCHRGIIVDRQLRSALPGVYALGECCETGGETFGLVAPCLAQAEVLAAQLAGQPVADFRHQVDGTRLKVSGISLFSAGDIREAESCVSFDPIAGDYRRLFLRDGRLSGVLLYGDCRQAAPLLAKLQAGERAALHTLFDTSPETQPQAAGSPMMSKPVLAVVGHGMVSHHFLEQLVARALHQRYHIVVYGEERLPAYDRVHLSSWFDGKSAADLSLVGEDFFAAHGIELRSDCRVVAIDRQQRSLRDSRGDELTW